MTIGIDIDREGGASVNGRAVNTTDICSREIDSAGGNSTDGKHILITGKAGITDVNIVADDIGIGTRVSAYRRKKIASAILKRRVTHRSIAAAVSVGLQRERAYGRIAVTVVIIDQGGCSQGTVFYARGVEQKRCGAHCRIGICIVGDQRSGANAGVEIGGASSKQRIPTKSCISSPAGEVTQRVAPFRRRETGIATIRRRTECLRFGQQRKAAKRQNY